jgi:lipocalin
MGVQQSKYYDKAIPLTNEDLQSKFFGLWYEIAVVSQQFESKCLGAIASYSDWNEKNQSFVVSNYCFWEDSGTKQIKWTCRIGEGIKLNPDKAQILVYFSNMPQFVQDILKSKKISDYNVVEFQTPTGDISNEYCVIFGTNDDYFWILSRNPNFKNTQYFTNLKENYSKIFENPNLLIRNPEIYTKFNIKGGECLADPSKQER